MVPEEKKQTSKKTAQEELQDLYAQLESVATTLPLATKPEDIVPGEGSATADILCIGEAPGQQEALERRPFVGRSGKLLRKQLVEQGLDLSELYIANIVKVRPPENRDPTLDEIEAYRPYLEKEIEIIEPTIIVTLGRFSMAAFLPNVKISQVHGRLHRVVYCEKQYYVFPMYHPAAALRGTKMLQAFQDDMKKIPKILAWIQEKRQSESLEEEVEKYVLQSK